MIKNAKSLTAATAANRALRLLPLAFNGNCYEIIRPRQAVRAFIALLALLIATEILSQGRYSYPTTIWAYGRVYGSCITAAIDWGNGTISLIEQSRIEQTLEANRTYDDAGDDLLELALLTQRINRIDNEHDELVSGVDRVVLLWSYGCAEAQSAANRIDYNQFNWFPVVSGLLYMPAPDYDG